MYGNDITFFFYIFFGKVVLKSVGERLGGTKTVLIQNINDYFHRTQNGVVGVIVSLIKKLKMIQSKI